MLNANPHTLVASRRHTIARRELLAGGLAAILAPRAARARPAPLRGAPRAVYGNPLRIKTYYILCSSAESTPIIVGHRLSCKRFLMHRKGVGKRQQKQPIARPFAAYPRTFHRIFTGLSTGVLADERFG